MNEEQLLEFGLTQKQYHLIRETIISFKEIEKVLVFGSRAAGKFEPSSDIDLAVIGENINAVIINRLSSTLEDLPLPFMFDVVQYNRIFNMALKSEIDNYAKIFFEKQLNRV